jgi:transposase
MSLRYGNRHQVTLFPSRVEDYIEPDNPVRVYDAFVDALDFEDLGISVDTNKRGCPQYDPHAMLKLFVYGTSYGIHSSRKLERACHDNVSFIWLMGSLKPDYKTISEFRRKNKASIRKVLRKSVDICVDLELIVGNVIFLDGSKIRANAGISKFWTREKLEEERENINRRIDELLEASEAADLEEEGLPSMSKINMKISSAEKMRKSIEKSLKQIEETERKREEKPSHKARKDQKEASANVIDPE